MKPKLKVIKNNNDKQRSWLKRKHLNRLLLVLGTVVLAQMVLGWVWSRYSYSVIETTRAETGFMESYLDIYGMISLEEEVVVVPRSGYFQPLVRDGKRVPVGKQLAIISSEPKAKPPDEVEEEGNFWENLPVIGAYFNKENEEDDSYQEAMFSFEDYIIAPEAGIVSFQVDGFEQFGPGNYPYLKEEEIVSNLEKFQEKVELDLNGRLTRGTPLLRIIDNYRWYISVVVDEETAAFLKDLPQLGIYFDFAPEERVQGRLVEAYEEGLDFFLTWEITRQLPDFYLQRATKVKLSYARQEGIVLPRSAIIDREEAEGVYLLEAGAARFQEVEIIQTDEEEALVEGLTHNCQVIINPESISDGMMAR